MLTVLHPISFEIAAGSTVSIVGPSGSGKTTLLGLCAGLDRTTSGQVILNGILLNDLGEDERARIRNQYVGFVFQNFQLFANVNRLGKCHGTIGIARRTKYPGQGTRSIR